MPKKSKKKPVKKSLSKQLDESKRNEILMGIQVVDAKRRLQEIASIIDRVEIRASAVDGPVTPTLREMTQEELTLIYQLARGHNVDKPLQVFVSQRLYPHSSLDAPVRNSRSDWYVHVRRGVQGFRMDFSGTRAEAEWYAHMLRLALMNGEGAGDTQDMLRDAGILIRRLLHRVKKDNPALPWPPIIKQAKDWLQRHGLQGSILREADQQTKETPIFNSFVKDLTEYVEAARAQLSPRDQKAADKALHEIVEGIHNRKLKGIDRTK